MHQIAFTIFGKDIHWYGVCIAVGFVLATWVLSGIRKHARMTQDHVLDIAITALVSGIAGARILYVIQYYDQFAGRSFIEWFRVDKGGLVFYGGFILAISCVALYAWRRKISIGGLLDVTAPSVALAHAFGRIGCFLQGCCHGIPSAKPYLGVVYPAGSEGARKFPDILSSSGCSVPLYPVQLLEAAMNLVLCAFLVWYMKKHQKRQGQTAGVYIMCYAVIRFILEFFRGDHRDYFLGMTPSQRIALFVMLPVGAAIFYLAGRIGGVSPEREEEAL